MTPVSSRILDYVVAQLLTVTCLSTDQVHTPSLTRTDTNDLPDILVQPASDLPFGDPETDSAGGQIRALTFTVDIAVVGQTINDTDAMAILCRKAVLSDPSLGCLVLDTYWAGQEWDGNSAGTGTVFTKLFFTARYNWSPEW